MNSLSNATYTCHKEVCYSTILPRYHPQVSALQQAVTKSLPNLTAGAPTRERDGLEKATTEAVIKALQSQASKSAPAGDVLVFLPGVAEIRK
jgi:HrpA-like RNA helicase